MTEDVADLRRVTRLLLRRRAIGQDGREKPRRREEGRRTMAVDTPVTLLTGVELMAHLFRRAGFGATRDEIEDALAKGYEATVEELLHPEQQPDIDFDILHRF